MIDKKYFGAIAGEKFYEYTLTSENIQLTVTDLGAHLTKLLVKDRKGQYRDVVLGFDTVEAYANNTDTYFGAIVGRNCNRIAGARFVLENQTYQMPKNEGDNNLHSGPNGYQLRGWQLEEKDEKENKVIFSLLSSNGDQGFPGKLQLKLTYQLLDDTVIIKYVGTSDATTIFNPTNHSYFNLNGHDSGDVLNHELQLQAAFYTPVKDAKSIPTGEILAVKGTPFDFTSAKKIGRDIQLKDQQLSFGRGYDHNFVVTAEIGEPFAVVYGPLSGIEMTVTTDLPGVQFYSGNFLQGNLGKQGATYPKCGGFCLETQYFPNSINTPSFVSPVLEKNSTKITETTYHFSVR